MSEEFDVFVIGTGVAGTTVAQRCREAGWSVGIVDDRSYGGTCQLRGCDPKKVMVGVAESLADYRRLAGRGLRDAEIGIDWSDLMAFKNEFTASVPEQTKEWADDLGIETFHGEASFTGERRLSVEDVTIEAEHIVIASGSKPRFLNVPGEHHLVTSEEFLNLEALPDDVTFVGGGYISFEFAHLAARAGANVRILDRSSQPLSPFEPDLVDIFLEASREVGIEVRGETKLQGVRRGDGFWRVDTELPSGEHRSFETELVVHGAGRTPNLESLNLEAAGVEREPRGVTVDDSM